MKLIHILLLLYVVCGKTKDEWKSRSIYQLLTDRFATSKGASTSCNLKTYCGGDYNGMIAQLDYIKNLGFDAIWISPVVDNYPGGYHGYWARDMYKTNDYFGSEQDLKNLVAECHKKDIWVMVDIVANHMGNTDQNYSQNKPFNSAEHYHTYCDITDSDFSTHNLNNIERCRLAGLADLNQDNSYVASELINWIKWLITTFQFDGIRIDTVMMVKAAYWKKFTDAAGVYSVGEVFDGDASFLKQFIGPMDGLLNYPLFYQLRDVFLHNKDMSQLESFFNYVAGQLGKANLAYMGNFNDNHDNPRFLSDKVNYSATKKAQFKSITAFTMCAIGIPAIYYGSEQLFAGADDPYNREVLWGSLSQTSEMYLYIQAINKARKSYASLDQVQRYADSEFYAFTRGNLFAAFSNKYDRQVVKTITFHPYSDGTTLCNIFYPTDCVKVASKAFNVYLNYGEVKIFLPK